ncbi:MAG: glycerol-3-phosphate 1-O-acyltransferase PlsY [Planctomycetes bacterium]|nr:glycerol-3-phosphate 1-O-acyltransferase PlsY [Planctomycetota bacterium]
MSFIVCLILCVVAGYLVGGLPFGVWVGKLRGIDIQAAGSGNIGATNVARLLGKPWGILVFFLDMLKGAVPTLAAGVVLATAAEHGPVVPPSALEIGRLLVGFSCIVGHNCSIYLRLRGGKGVATSLGVTMGVFPDLTYPALCAVGVWLVVVLATRYVSLASLAACVTLPVAFLGIWARQDNYLADHWPLGIFALFVSVLIMVRHRSNIRRLLGGTESRIGRSSIPDPGLGDRQGSGRSP